MRVAPPVGARSLSEHRSRPRSRGRGMELSADLGAPLLVRPAIRPTMHRRRFLLAIIIAAAALAILAAPRFTQPLLAALPPIHAAPPVLRVLITGYQPWGNMGDVNPAREVAVRLNGSCDHGVCFEGIELPVSREGAMRVARILAEVPHGGAAPWDAIVHLGFESVAKGLRLEIAAANVLSNESSHAWSAEVPCNKSLTGWRDIAPGAPCLLATTAPLERVRLDDEVALSGFNPPLAELWSRDAGTFFCNEVLYRTLYEVRRRHIRPANAAGPFASFLPAMFIHLPAAGVASTETAARLVQRIAAQMAGRPFPPVSLPAKAAALSASEVAEPCDGSYEGQQLAWGFEVRIRAVVRRTRGATAGLMNLSVSSTGGLPSFQCEHEVWSVQAEHSHAALSRIVVREDECWRENVLANIDDLKLLFDAANSTVLLMGRHRIGPLWSIQLRATLQHATGPC